jgi:hypothetical protein
MAPNDEFIREVDEEYRRDRLAQIWTRYNGVIIGAAFLVVASVGGWRYWEHVQETRSQAAAGRYEEALSLSRQDKSDEAEAALQALAKEDGTGYGLLARFRLAAELGQQSPEDGASAYDALSNDGNLSPLWRDLARLRWSPWPPPATPGATPPGNSWASPALRQAIWITPGAGSTRSRRIAKRLPP